MFSPIDGLCMFLLQEGIGVYVPGQKCGEWFLYNHYIQEQLCEKDVSFIYHLK